MNSSNADSEFVRLLTDHQIMLRIYVQSLMPGDQAARDVTQQANLTLWKRKAEFELGTNFKAWAFSVARYEVLSHRKRQARDARLVFSEDLESIMAEELPERVDDLEHQLTALRECIEKLRPKARDLIRYRYFQRGTLKDYAKQAGRSVGGLKVTLHRIRNTLLHCIELRMKAEEARQ